MTPAYISPPRAKRIYKFSPVRVIVMGLMLFVLISACLYLYHVSFREYGVYLTDAEKKSTAWMMEQLSFMLPFIAIAAFQYAVYARHDNRDGILQKERAYELLVAAALTYLVLVPFLCWYSDAKLILSLMAKTDVPKNAGKEYETLMMQLTQWFLRLSIPLCLLFVYHMARAKAEATETAQNAAREATLAETEIEAPQATEPAILADALTAETAIPADILDNSTEETVKE